MKRLSLTLLTLICFAFNPAKAQFDPGPLIQGSAADANYLANGYLTPLGEALTAGMNNGWYYTAKTHKLGRFDLMLNASILFVPDASKMFTIDNSQLGSMTLQSGASSTEAPSVFGGGDGVDLQINGTTQTFSTPTGLDASALVVPALGLNVGLIKNTDIGIRYVPTFNIPGDIDAEISQFGFSVKHDFLQWIPGGKALPFDASLLFGYTSLQYDQKINDVDQTLAMESTAYTIRALISKKILFLTIYGGAGLNSGSTDINIAGTFDLETPAGTQTSVLNLNSNADAGSSFVGNVGLRLKFLFVMALAVDYTFGDFNAVNAGLGFSIDF